MQTSVKLMTFVFCILCFVLYICMCFKDDYAFRWRCGDYQFIEIKDIRNIVKNRYYIAPRFHITYL